MLKKRGSFVFCTYSIWFFVLNLETVVGNVVVVIDGGVSVGSDSVSVVGIGGNVVVVRGHGVDDGLDGLNLGDFGLGGNGHGVSVLDGFVDGGESLLGLGDLSRIGHVSVGDNALGKDILEGFSGLDDVRGVGEIRHLNGHALGHGLVFLSC